MDVPTTDRHGEKTVSTTGVEKGVVFVLVAIVALAFFWLTIVGLATVQKVTTKDISESGNEQRASAVRESVDIGIIPAVEPDDR